MSKKNTPPTETTLAALLKQRDEIDTQIKKLRMPYEEGDKVLVVGTISATDDPEDTSLPYEIAFENCDGWFMLSEIRGRA